MLAGLQWMPTLNLEPGLSKPKAIKLHADSAAEVKQVQGTKLAAESEPTIDWPQLEQTMLSLFLGLKGCQYGLVSKADMRAVLLRNRVGGTLPATKTLISRLMARLDALYGQLTFGDVSQDELVLGKT